MQSMDLEVVNRRLQNLLHHICPIVDPSELPNFKTKSSFVTTYHMNQPTIQDSFGCIPHTATRCNESFQADLVGALLPCFEMVSTSEFIAQIAKQYYSILNKKDFIA